MYSERENPKRKDKTMNLPLIFSLSLLRQIASKTINESFIDSFMLHVELTVKVLHETKSEKDALEYLQELIKTYKNLQKIKMEKNQRERIKQ